MTRSTDLAVWIRRKPPQAKGIDAIADGEVDAEVVAIIGIFYGGQDYETLLHGDPEDGGADG